jgi:outer membrane protein OmpA-like peptidoglycan-associated protein
MKGKDGYPTDRRVDIVVNNRLKKKKNPPPPSSAKPTQMPVVAHKVNISSIDEVKDLKPGSIFLLKNVYFPAGSHVMKPESAETLQKLFEVLKANPGLKISIEGHVCCIQEDEPDALDIYGYLVTKGIDASRLVYSGYGKRRPIVAEEMNEEDAERNRRVEIRVLENK